MTRSVYSEARLAGFKSPHSVTSDHGLNRHALVHNICKIKAVIVLPHSVVMKIYELKGLEHSEEGLVYTKCLVDVSH